ncbi:hypothetical protein NPF69_004583 [Salmonella enterica]|nr:hypothetical protein [Salmonella enterica]
MPAHIVGGTFPGSLTPGETGSRQDGTTMATRRPSASVMPVVVRVCQWCVLRVLMP